MNIRIRQATVAALLAWYASGVSAHDEAHGKASAEKQAPAETAFGISADGRKVSRTVQVTMSDRMRFSPDKLNIKRGDTVRFVVSNEGRTMHEMVLGTMAELKQHAELMRKYPGMEHEEPYMAHVPPGRTETIVWQFTKPGEFYYGCLVPGHFEAGMIGKIIVR